MWFSIAFTQPPKPQHLWFSTRSIRLRRCGPEGGRISACSNQSLTLPGKLCTVMLFDQGIHHINAAAPPAQVICCRSMVNRLRSGSSGNSSASAGCVPSGPSCVAPAWTDRARITGPPDTPPMFTPCRSSRANQRVSFGLS